MRNLFGKDFLSQFLLLIFVFSIVLVMLISPLIFISQSISIILIRWLKKITKHQSVTSIPCFVKDGLINF